jgi:hypothetical protein
VKGISIKSVVPKHQADPPVRLSQPQWLLHELALDAGVAARAASKRAVLLRPLLAVMCFGLIVCVHSSRTEGDAGDAHLRCRWHMQFAMLHKACACLSAYGLQL